jgi:uncharacterized protein YybS (DUF2232 family)
MSNFHFLKKVLKYYFSFFFRFFILRIICIFMSILYNTEIMEKAAQSIRKNGKNAIFRTFFRFWTFFLNKKNL